jgi:uncharacterized protein (DUF697 family)/tellurite resistance protein
MTEAEKQQIALGCIAAAFADGRLDELERLRIQRLMENLGGMGGDDLFRTVLDHRVEPEQLASRLTTPESRRAAYQMALLVCTADGALNTAEENYLERLRDAFGLSEAAAKGIRLEADAYRDPGLPPTAPTPPAPGEDPAHIILRYAMLAGAAELLPQTAASMIVLPLQLKLVYDIGSRHGVTMGRDQIRELVAAFGIGATSQVVESLARRIFGGVARTVGGGGMLGGLLGGAAGAATGTLVSFATTYALGHAAEAYYGKGRTLSEADLRALFTRFQEDARTLYPKVEAEIRDQASRLDAQALLAKVRSMA